MHFCSDVRNLLPSPAQNRSMAECLQIFSPFPLACKGYETIIRSKKPAISSSQIISVSTLEHSYFMAHPLDRRG